MHLCPNEVVMTRLMCYITAKIREVEQHCVMYRWVQKLEEKFIQYVQSNERKIADSENRRAADAWAVISHGPYTLDLKPV